MSISLTCHDTVVQNHKNTTFAEIHGEMVLLNQDFGKYYGLDDIASEVWTRISSPINVGVLCSELAVEYGTSVAKVELDVLLFLQSLREENLIAVIPYPPSSTAFAHTAKSS